MSFPLLRLPDLALEEVLEQLIPKEILFLAQTSLQARRRISRHRKSYTVEIRVEDEDSGSFVEISRDCQEDFRIQVKNTRKRFDSSWRFQRSVPVRYEGDTLVSQWKQIDTAIQEILDFLMEIFQIEKVSFRICGSIDTHSAVLIVEHCISKNLKIGTIWWPFCKTDEIDKRILEASKHASDLCIIESRSSTICFNDFHLFRMYRLEILNARWMTVEQIVALRNCKQVELGYVRFDEESLNKILLGWMEDAGELEEVAICTHRRLEMEDVIIGLNLVRVQGGRNLKYYFITHNGTLFSVKASSAKSIVMKREEWEE
uniref:F-box domain-containing protein n=1 Tax=Caenorhabditis tropicalis TaxID=1561998 RepID=A0A1I7UT58_9PELO